jgi:serine/threonine protein phosphatase PrpC
MSEAVAVGVQWCTSVEGRPLAALRHADCSVPRHGSTSNQDSLVQAVRDCLDTCQERVAALATQPGVNPGSTVVALVMIEQDHMPYWLLANLGDSRAYRVSDGTLSQLSHDHSVVQELLDAGEIHQHEVGVHPERHVITRAIGIDAGGEADYSLIPVEAGTTSILCSDGVSGDVDAERMADIADGAPDPAECARRLVGAAVAAGNRDDATAVVIEVLEVATATKEGYPATTSISVDTVPGGSGRRA